MDTAIEIPDGAVTDFLRYYVLVRVFQGDIEAWLEVLLTTDRGQSDDARFLRWLRQRLSADPHLLDRIRMTVDVGGLWPGDSQPQSH